MVSDVAFFLSRASQLIRGVVRTLERWSMTEVLLLALAVSAAHAASPATSADERGGDDHPRRGEVVAYGKKLDVQVLDQTLSPEPLDRYLARILPPKMKVEWSSSDCDLKPASFPRPHDHPLCATVRGHLERDALRLAIQVGTHGDPINGKPSILVLWVTSPTSDPKEPFAIRHITSLGALAGAFR
jgi:hypothetical protein